MELFPLLILPIPLDVEREWQRQLWPENDNGCIKFLLDLIFSHCTTFSFGEDNTVLYLTGYYDNLCNLIFSHFTLAFGEHCVIFDHDQPVQWIWFYSSNNHSMLILLATVKQKVETLSRLVTFEHGAFLWRNFPPPIIINSVNWV